MNTINASDDDNLRRIADALERIADAYARKLISVNTTLTGNYAGSKEDLAKSIQDVIRKAVKNGQIPRNWAEGENPDV